MKVEANPLAYQYLISKIDLARKRRNERLPSLAKITPTLATYQGKRQHLIPSDESFLSVIKHKKYGKYQYEKISAQDRSYIVDHKDDHEDVNHSFSVERNISHNIKGLERANTSIIEPKTKLPNFVFSNEKFNSNNASNFDQKCLLLQKVNPWYEDLNKSLEPIIAVQTRFRDSNIAPKKKIRPAYSFEAHKGNIHRISSRAISKADYSLAENRKSIDDISAENSLKKEESPSNRNSPSPNSNSLIQILPGSPSKNKPTHLLLKKITQNAIHKRKENAVTLNDSDLSLFPTANKSVLNKLAGARSASIGPNERLARSPSKERVPGKNQFLAQMLVKDERQPLIPKLVAKSTNTELMPISKRNNRLKSRVDFEAAIKITSLQKSENNDQSILIQDTREKSFSFPSSLKPRIYQRKLSNMH